MIQLNAKKGDSIKAVIEVQGTAGVKYKVLYKEGGKKKPLSPRFDVLEAAQSVQTIDLGQWLKAGPNYFYFQFQNVFSGSQTYYEAVKIFIGNDVHQVGYSPTDDEGQIPYVERSAQITIT